MLLSPITAFWGAFSLSSNADLSAWGSLGSEIRLQKVFILSKQNPF